MTKPKGYDEEFVEFWCEDQASGRARLAFWRWLRETAECAGDTYGGPCKFFWEAPCAKPLAFYPVDAWELWNAIHEGELPEHDVDALLAWAQTHAAGPEAVWPVVLGFTPERNPAVEEASKAGPPLFMLRRRWLRGSDPDS